MNRRWNTNDFAMSRDFTGPGFAMFEQVGTLVREFAPRCERFYLRRPLYRGTLRRRGIPRKLVVSWASQELGERGICTKKFTSQ